MPKDDVHGRPWPCVGDLVLLCTSHSTGHKSLCLYLGKHFDEDVYRTEVYYWFDLKRNVVKKYMSKFHWSYYEIVAEYANAVD